MDLGKWRVFLDLQLSFPGLERVIYALCAAAELERYAGGKSVSLSTIPS